MANFSSSSSYSPEQVQSKFQSSLTNLGYSGTVGNLPPTLNQNKKLFDFVKTVVDKLNQEHHLTSQEIARYEELKSAGAVLEGELFQQALSRLSDTADRGQNSLENATREVEELRLKVASAKSQLSTLTAVNSKLSAHHATLSHERDELASQRTVCQRRLQVAMDTASQDNTKLNTAAQELESSIHSVCQFHRREEGQGSRFAPKLLSQLPQDDYHSSESQYLTELTAYSKKQFFEGIANMAAAEDMGSECTDLDLGDQEEVLLRGLSQEQYQAHCQELSRLQDVYQVTEMKYLNGKMAEQYAVAAAIRAREELSHMQDPDRDRFDVDTLSNQIAVKKSKLAGLQSQVSEVSSTILPALLKDMATLKVTAILHGDHNLKLARQEYFTSKQEKVIGWLRSQKARHEMLSMLYEVELRRHRETHRLLSAARKQVVEWKTHRENRFQGLKSAGLIAATKPRQTVDSDDVFTQCVCTLLDLTQTPEAPFITIEALRMSLKQLTQRMASTESVLQARYTEQATLVEEQEQLLRRLKLQGAIYDEDKITLTDRGYLEESVQLKSVVTSMEKNIKALLKQFDTHRKSISANPSLNTERQLFIYFFTDVNKLRSVIGEISNKIDVLASVSTS